MSEREFELYLTVLSGMMKLSSRQRKDLAEELRSHMDERLDELIADGLTRDEAIQTALEEFGDAAGLADSFTQIAQLKQRRRIMRWTTGTIAATTCAILTLASFWPEQTPVAPSIVNRSEAQSKPDSSSSAVSTQALSAQARIEKKLSEPFPAQIEFIDMPLSDVLEMISMTLETDILVSPGCDLDASLSESVDLHLSYGKVSTKTLFTLLFEKFQASHDVGYVILDEIIYLTDKSNALTVQVYDCRDLIGAVAGADEMMMGEAEAGGYEDYESGAGIGLGGGFGTASPGMSGGGGYGAMTAGTTVTGFPPQHQLISVITQTIEPNSWNDRHHFINTHSGPGPGGSGSAQLLNGLLIVKNSSDVHEQIEELLQMVRDASRGKPKVKPVTRS